VTAREIVFWEVGDENERLFHATQDEAIYDWVSDNTCDGVDPHSWRIPTTLQVCGYARMAVEPPDPERLLEDLFEPYEEEYGDPDGMWTPTAKMRELAEAFVTAVWAEWRPWACEMVKHETVDLRAWMEEHGSRWWPREWPGMDSPLVTWIKEDETA